VAMSNDLIVLADSQEIYPKFDLVRNKVKIFKGVEFDIDNFLCLTMLNNHIPEAVSMVQVHGEDVVIYYDYGEVRRVTLEERKVLWEKYTEFMIEVRRRMLPPEPPEGQLQIKEQKVIIIS
jgi:hypothetical protein